MGARRKAKAKKPLGPRKKALEAMVRGLAADVVKKQAAPSGCLPVERGTEFDDVVNVPKYTSPCLEAKRRFT